MKKLLLLSVLLAFLPVRRAYAAEYTYHTVPEQKIKIAVDHLNVRTGPGVDYPIVRVVKKNQVFDIIGALESTEKPDVWYITLLDDGAVGMVLKDYVECLDYRVGGVRSDDEPTTAKLLEIINAVRVDNKLPKFKDDERLNGIAQMKAADMAENLRLDHVSKKYGTPFVMLKESGILYKSASETIERNADAEEAYSSITSSPSGRSNIINARFNKMGIGISQGSDGKYYFALMFTEE